MKSERLSSTVIALPSAGTKSRRGSTVSVTDACGGAFQRGKSRSHGPAVDAARAGGGRRCHVWRALRVHAVWRVHAWRPGHQAGACRREGTRSSRPNNQDLLRRSHCALERSGGGEAEPATLRCPFVSLGSKLRIWSAARVKRTTFSPGAKSVPALMHSTSKAR